MTAPPKKILTVDDSKTVRRILAALFAPFGCTICEAADGEEGLAVAALEKPDLILLDYNMPVMDGLTMLQRLREDAAMRHTPVIFLTAEAGAKNIAAAARLGARDYVTKPFQDEVLIAKVARIITLGPRSTDQSATDQPEAAGATSLRGEP
jgi:two-component system chemotaxis response regulator CheY